MTAAKIERATLTLGATLLLAAAAALAQHQHQSGAISAPAKQDEDAQQINHSVHAMSSRHLDIGAHMRMTPLRKFQPGDQQRADEIVQAARKALDAYKDYREALRDGYQIFLPNVPQKMYHFTNYMYGFEAAFKFDPSHPTSLLYEKKGDQFRLIGAMYTAPAQVNLEELDRRIPLSVAQWHLHVNLCMPPPERRQEALPPNAKFGLLGSIATREACDAAGGAFMPHVFGWMVHLYPFEQKVADIWSVERQMHEGQGHSHRQD